MPDFRTIVPCNAIKQPIDIGSTVYLTGSCFAENIAEKLTSFRIPNSCNPFGVIFNPISIGETLKYHANKTIFDADSLLLSEDLYRHPDFHSKVVGVTPALALEQIHHAVNLGNDCLLKATHLIITLGTSLVYKLKTTNKIVANNHKLPSSSFEKIQLSVNEVQASLFEMLSLTKLHYPNLSVIFTISPVRHWRDGAIESNRSKAVLIDALHLVLAEAPEAYYFPAYEIMMDELRDYRFYDEDMLHPNNIAINYIWEQFVKCCLSPKMQKCVADQKEINAAMQHRPFFPDSKKHLAFKSAMLNRITDFQKKYPAINIDDAITYFSNH